MNNNINLDYDIAVIGAGFYGLFIANQLARNGFSVVVFEEEQEVMNRASFSNQARVHNGYHYPRNLLTAFRSRVSFPKFCEDFRGAIVDDFDKYYAIARHLSKVDAKQFLTFSNVIGAYIERAESSVASLFNARNIEDVFVVKEVAFDANLLKQIMLARISKTNIKIFTENRVVKVFEEALAPCLLDSRGDVYRLKKIYNCTYSSINQLNKNSNLPCIKVKNELTEICMVDVPPILMNKGVTVMCGPFFSIMPFPSRKKHSFTHVRYTPHFEWVDEGQRFDRTALRGMKSNFYKMRSDAARFLPCLKDLCHSNSLFEVKSVLLSSEKNDSRPILLKNDFGIEGYNCVLGGKIDNVYDVMQNLEGYNYVSSGKEDNVCDVAQNLEGEM